MPSWASSPRGQKYAGECGGTGVVVEGCLFGGEGGLMGFGTWGFGCRSESVRGMDGMISGFMFVIVQKCVLLSKMTAFLEFGFDVCDGFVSDGKLSTAPDSARPGR